LEGTAETERRGVAGRDGSWKLDEERWMDRDELNGKI